MKFLRWLGGVIVFFWMVGLIFKIGGKLIHLLLILAVISFLLDFIRGRKK